MTIEVVSALIVKSNLVFLQKRPETSLRPDLWEPPGGKVEVDESPSAALIRELREKLGLKLPARSLGPVVDIWECHLSYSFRVSLRFVELPEPVDIPAVLVPDLETLNLCRPRSRDRMWVDLNVAVEHLPCVPSIYSFYKRIQAFIDPKRCRCGDTPKPRFCRAHSFIVEPERCWSCGQPSSEGAVDGQGLPHCGRAAC